MSQTFFEGRPFRKDPDATLDYVWDWTDWLQEGEGISSHTVEVPDGITLDETSADGEKVKAWLSGGTAGETYTVTCRITTNSTPARTDDRSIRLWVVQR